MDVNTSLPVNPLFNTTSIGDREPGKNFYFRSPRKRANPQPEADEELNKSGQEEPDHHIDVVA